MSAADGRDPRHIALLGLMGAGKSTIGRALAQALHVPYVDNDDALEDRLGMDAATYAATTSIESLHHVEAGILLDHLRASHPTVVSAAASVVEVAACREAVARRAVAVWLRADLDALAARVGEKPHRPLGDDVLAQLRDQAERRDPWHAALADLVVDVSAHDDDASVRAIVEHVRTMADLTLPGPGAGPDEHS